MKKIFSFVAATALAAGMLTSCQQGVQPNTLTEAEKAEGWQLLFDGQTLDGWRSYNRDTLACTYKGKSANEQHALNATKANLQRTILIEEDGHKWQ